MMIKTDSGYLDFDDAILIERQVYLFEDIGAQGDFSYQFEVAKTHNNLTLLGLPFPDVFDKTVYQKINADILSDSGETLYKGYLKVESSSTAIRCSFFSGNNNWMNLLTGNMTELDLSAYDQDLTEANIVSRFGETEGIVFPLIDTGALVSRSYRNLKTEDFVGAFYLKTLLKETFRQCGLKITGELLNDPHFNTAIITANTRSKTEVDNHSVYVGKNGVQVIPVASFVDVEFNLQTNPYFIGENITFSSDTTYSSPTQLVADIDVTWDANTNVLASLIANGSLQITGAGDVGSLSLKNFRLNASGTVKLQLSNFAGGPTNITGGTLKVTPKFIYKAFGSSTVPLWTKQEFVSNVLGIFNVIPDYDPYSKTVTLNLFDKIKSKEPIDLSQYLRVTEVDYTEFISEYGRNTTLTYQESSDEDLREYNIATFNKYGAGVIEVDNDFISESAPIFESDFSSPISYIHPHLGCSIEKVSFVELEDDDEQELTSVTDSGGTPRFNITDADDFFTVGDLVRIDSKNIAYNGEFVVSAVTSTYIEVRGLAFDTDTTGAMTRLSHVLTSDDSVYIFINSGERDVVDFSNTDDSLYIEDSNYTEASLAFFNLIQNDTQFNTDFKQSLSFGAITDPLFYQRTLMESYWGVVSNVLNDPVKLFCVGYIPEKIYRDITPLRPVYLKTEQTTNLYYINRISGYQGGSIPFEVELIKLP